MSIIPLLIALAFYRIAQAEGKAKGRLDQPFTASSAG